MRTIDLPDEATQSTSATKSAQVRLCARLLLHSDCKFAKCVSTAGLASVLQEILMQEAGYLMMCQHPHVIQLFGVAVDESNLSIQMVMECLHGRSVRRIMSGHRQGAVARPACGKTPFTLLQATEILQKVRLVKS